MIKRLTRLFYRNGWLRRYDAIDDLRYLKRLASGKTSEQGNYFSDSDKAQYAAESDVVVRFAFGGRPCLMAARPDSHVEANLLRDPQRAARLLDLIAPYLRGGRFVDVGANVGTFSIPLGLAFPDVAVSAYEPNPAAIARFRANAALNGAPSNIDLRPIGLGETEGEFTLYGFSDRDLGQSSLLKPQHHTEAPQEIAVRVRRLDDDLQDSPQRVDAIKIDVQGLELAVLRGAEKTIARDRPAVLFEHEDHNFAQASEAMQTKESLREFFARLDYEVLYVSKKSTSLLFPANWSKRLNGDLLALPVGRARAAQA